MDSEEIKKAAIIYKKEPLSTYHLRVNEASQDICLRQLSLLRNRGRLLVLAQERVHESGYAYRKGKSRSKSFGNGVEETRVKRVKTSTDERTARMKAIKEELHDLKDRLSFKRKRIEAAESSKNYKLCDQLSEEMGELNKTKRLLEMEKNVLERKESKSHRYFKRKSRRESDSDSSSSTSSKRSPLLSPPVKSATPRLISPPPLTVNAPTTPGRAESKSTSSSEPMGMLFQASTCTSEPQQCIDLTGDQAQVALQEQEATQSVDATDKETPIVQPTVVSGGDQTRESDTDQSF